MLMMHKHLFPMILKEIFPHIPTIAFKMVEWKSFLKEASPILKRISHRRPSPHIYEKLKSLKPKDIVFQPDEALVPKIKQSLRTDHGYIILALFFTQLTNEEGIFLDLRTKHFIGFEDKLIYLPNNLWAHFETDFRRDLINLYCGFYWNDDVLFEKSLENIGLTQNLSQEHKDELIHLFKKHFGLGSLNKVQFNLKNFQDSFYDLFHFFLRHNIKLRSEFLFLGVYLATLYLSLEEIGGSYDVQKTFVAIFPQK